MNWFPFSIAGFIVTYIPGYTYNKQKPTTVCVNCVWNWHLTKIDKDQRHQLHIVICVCV